MQTKVIRFIAVVFIACLVVAGGYAVWLYGTGIASRATWYAVYLDTGDLYFGHLSSFPSFSLSDAWYVQHSPQGSASISDFSKVSWKPVGSIQLNRQHVVWTARIASDSPLIAAMNAPAPAGGTASGLENLPFSPPENNAPSSSASSVPGSGY